MQEDLSHTLGRLFVESWSKKDLSISQARSIKNTGILGMHGSWMVYCGFIPNPLFGTISAIAYIALESTRANTCTATGVGAEKAMASLEAIFWTPIKAGVWKI